MFGWYGELGGSRQMGMQVNPITYTEIEAWAKATGRKPQRWEIGVLKRLDGLFMAHVAKESEDKRKR